MLDGGLAVLCNPKPAYAGLIRHSEYYKERIHFKRGTTMKIGSDNILTYKLRQDRKVATVSSAKGSCRETWLELESVKVSFFVIRICCTTDLSLVAQAGKLE